MTNMNQQTWQQEKEFLLYCKNSLLSVMRMVLLHQLSSPLFQQAPQHLLPSNTNNNVQWWWMMWSMGSSGMISGVSLNSGSNPLLGSMLHNMNANWWTNGWNFSAPTTSQSGDWTCSFIMATEQWLRKVLENNEHIEIDYFILMMKTWLAICQPWKAQ